MVIQTIKYSIFSTEFCNLKQNRNPSFIYTLLYIEVRLNTRIYLLRIPYFCVSSKPIVMAAEKKTFTVHYISMANRSREEPFNQEVDSTQLTHNLPLQSLQNTNEAIIQYAHNCKAHNTTQYT